MIQSADWFQRKMGIKVMDEGGIMEQAIVGIFACAWFAWIFSQTVELPISVQGGALIVFSGLFLLLKWFESKPFEWPNTERKED